MEAVLDVERRVGVEVGGRPAGAREVVPEGRQVRRDADRRSGGVLLARRCHSGQQRGDRGGRPRGRCPGALGLPRAGEDAIDLRRRRPPAAVEPDRVAARGVEEEDDQGVVSPAGLDDPQIRDHDAGGGVSDETEHSGRVGGDRQVLVSESGSGVEGPLQDRRRSGLGGAPSIVTVRVAVPGACAAQAKRRRPAAAPASGQVSGSPAGTRTPSWRTRDGSTTMAGAAVARSGRSVPAACRGSPQAARARAATRPTTSRREPRPSRPRVAAGEPGRADRAQARAQVAQRPKRVMSWLSSLKPRGVSARRSGGQASTSKTRSQTRQRK